MCSKGDAASVCPGDSCRVIEVPIVEDCLQPVINVVLLQVYLHQILDLSVFHILLMQKMVYLILNKSYR